MGDAHYVAHAFCIAHRLAYSFTIADTKRYTYGNACFVYSKDVW
jgi:hypothetical protein